MKIAINCRDLNKRHGGPRRFLLSLIKSITQIDKNNNYYLILDRRFLFPFPLPKNFTIINLNTNSKIIFEYLNLPILSYKKTFDIMIFPNPAFAPYIRSKKIPIFHDIIYFEKSHKREFKFFDNLHHKIVMPISSKASIFGFCVSKFTEKRVRKLLKLKRTSTIHEGVSPNFVPEKNEIKKKKVIEKYNIKLPFVFYIGSLSPRKNVPRIIRAFSKSQNKISHRLYIFSSYSWHDKETRKILENQYYRDFIETRGHINEKDLPTIYSLASVLIYPSLYEGFGLPILEAQSCGCPVITSNKNACSEIAGKSAHLVNPYSISEIRDGILKIVQDPIYAKDLKKRGYQNVKRFNWENTANKFVSTLNKL